MCHVQRKLPFKVYSSCYIRIDERLFNLMENNTFFLLASGFINHQDKNR